MAPTPLDPPSCPYLPDCDGDPKQMKKTMSRPLLFSIGCAVFLPTAALAADPPTTLDERLAPAPAGGLTADQVAARAQQTSFDAAARRAAIDAAEARVDQAKAAYYPRLTVTGR